MTGGFEKGLEQAGYEFGYHGFSEIEPHASAVYRYNFPTADELGSIVDINEEHVKEDIDIICAGFCCQSYSSSGHQKGLDDPRGQLVFHMIRLLKELQPKVFIGENVKGFMSHENGDAFETILEGISGAGYAVDWELVNTREKLPHERPRIYIVGIRKDLCNQIEGELYVEKGGIEEQISKKLKHQPSLFSNTFEREEVHNSITQFLREKSEQEILPYTHPNQPYRNKLYDNRRLITVGNCRKNEGGFDIYSIRSSHGYANCIRANIGSTPMILVEKEGEIPSYRKEPYMSFTTADMNKDYYKKKDIA